MDNEISDYDRYIELLKTFGINYEVESHLNIIVVYTITDDGGKNVNVNAMGFTFVFRERDGKFLSTT